MRLDLIDFDFGELHFGFRGHFYTTELNNVKYCDFVERVSFHLHYSCYI